MGTTFLSFNPPAPYQPELNGTSDYGGCRTSGERLPDHCSPSFFGYARQDRKDQPRVPITAKLVANLLVAAGVNRVLAMDLHAQQIQGFFDIPVDHLFCAPIFYKYIAEKKIPDLVVVTPDIGGMKMAAAYSQMLNSGLAIVSKKRLNASETQSTHLIGDVEEKIFY